jgi:hypothetical protein
MREGMSQLDQRLLTVNEKVYGEVGRDKKGRRIVAATKNSIIHPYPLPHILFH